MIDYDLIEKNCHRARMSAEQAASTLVPNLWIVKDFVTEDILDKLESYIDQSDPQQWTLVSGQESMPRHKITWDADSVIEELHDVCASITSQLEQQFQRQLNFAGIQIWRDTEGYYFGPHTDNPVINISLQLYLFDAPSSCGTTFFVNGARYVVGFFHNFGYICTSHNVQHQTTTPVPAGVNRYSLYAHWTSRPAMPTGVDP